MIIDDRLMLPIGTLLQDGKYRVERYLSSGGFGNTYVVVNTAFDERMAMKEFFMKGVSQRDGNTSVSVSNTENIVQFDSQREKFKKEARRLRKLNNANIVRVHDLFEENGTAYYVMDYVDGESLSARLKREGHPLLLHEVQRIFDQVLNALEDVHRQQIWHLDLKPGNIMMDQQGHVKLIDFGASKQMDAKGDYASTSSTLCYTQGFAPSEQVEGDVKRIGPWTDFYALGATLYNLLTNEQPPELGDVKYDGAAAFHFPASVGDDMRQLILWLMQSNYHERPQSVAEIRQWLTASKTQQKPQQQSEATQLHVQGEETQLHGNTPPVDEAATRLASSAPSSTDSSETRMAQPQMIPQEEKSNHSSCLIAGLIALALIVLVILVGIFMANNNKKEAYLEEYVDSMAMEPYYESDAVTEATVAADTVPAEECEADSIVYLNNSNTYNHDMGYGETIHHHFEGSMTDHMGPHPIMLDFDFANRYPFQLENVVYTNVTFGGKIRMTGYVSGGWAYLSGRDGSNDFDMNFSMWDFDGSATVGSKSLTVELTPYACSH